MSNPTFDAENFNNPTIRNPLSTLNLHWCEIYLKIFVNNLKYANMGFDIGQFDSKYDDVNLSIEDYFSSFIVYIMTLLDMPTNELQYVADILLHVECILQFNGSNSNPQIHSKLVELRIKAEKVKDRLADQIEN